MVYGTNIWQYRAPKGEEEEEEAEEEEEEEDQGIEEELYDDSADDQVSDSGGDDFAEYYINAPPLKSSSSTKSRKKRTKVFDAAKNREVKVVVIGAGMAGITAARKLRYFDGFVYCVSAFPSGIWSLM